MSKWDAIGSAADLDEQFDELDDFEQFQAEIDDSADLGEAEADQGGQVYDPPALKMADAANLRDIHPFLGYAWRELEGELKRDALVWLREWVDWFVPTYKVDRSLFPGCWFLHSEVVEYAWVAANAEVKSWHNPDASLTPFTSWHSYLPAFLQRLGTGSQTRCFQGHQEDYKDPGSGLDPNAVAVDEIAWQRTLAGFTDEQCEVAAGRWRAVVEDSEGMVAYSDGVEVPAQAELILKVSGPVLAFDGMGQPKLSVEVAGQNLSRTWWEYQDESGTWVKDEFSVQSVGEGHE